MPVVTSRLQWGTRPHRWEQLPQLESIGPGKPRSFALRGVETAGAWYLLDQDRARLRSALVGAAVPRRVVARRRDVVGSHGQRTALVGDAAARVDLVRHAVAVVEDELRTHAEPNRRVDRRETGVRGGRARARGDRDGELI